MRTLLISIYLCVSLPLWAQTLVPATSEDLNEFDKQVARQLNKAHPGRSGKSNFGSEVSAAAKAMKGSKDSVLPAGIASPGNSGSGNSGHREEEDDRSGKGKGKGSSGGSELNDSNSGKGKKAH